MNPSTRPRQKDFLIGEVNHRVQNSLQLVSSFLRLQARGSDDPVLHGEIDEACRRISAVSLVHRRLYRADQLESVDVGRYIDELLDDLVSSMGFDWERQLVRDLQPGMLPTDRAVGLGLIVTELVINANKYVWRRPGAAVDHARRGGKQASIDCCGPGRRPILVSQGVW